MMRLRRVAALFAPDAIRSFWQLLGRLFGSRRRRLIVHPMLGTVIALSETASLLSIIRLLLLLVDGGDSAALSVGPIVASFSFGGLAAVAAVTLAITLLARILEARASARNQAFALREARRLAIDAWFGADWEQLHAARLGRLQQLLGLNAQQAVVPLQLLSVGSVALISLTVYLAIIILSAYRKETLKTVATGIANSRTCGLRSGFIARSSQHPARRIAESAAPGFKPSCAARIVRRF